MDNIPCYERGDCGSIPYSGTKSSVWVTSFSMSHQGSALILGASNSTYINVTGGSDLLTGRPQNLCPPYKNTFKCLGQADVAGNSFGKSEVGRFNSCRVCFYMELLV